MVNKSYIIDSWLLVLGFWFWVLGFWFWVFGSGLLVVGSTGENTINRRSYECKEK